MKKTIVWTGLFAGVVSSCVAAGDHSIDSILEDNPFRDVRVIDKFGTWPDKQGEPYYSSQVGTWFTVWWTARGAKTFDHWTRHDWTRLRPVDYGYYCSGDEDYLTHVLLRLKYIGIDFLALDDTNGHWNDFGLIAENMARCFEVADRLGTLSPQIAVCTGGPLRDHNPQGQTKELDAYYADYVEKHPGVYYEWKGKPLVIMYLAGEAGQRITDDRFAIRYGTGFISWQGKTKDPTLFRTQGNWGWVFDRQNEGSEVFGVQPGYNKAHQGHGIKHFERESGKRYIAQWLAAIKADPECIMIPSYNDHAEETGWEATAPIRPARPAAAQDVPGEDPYLYEKITEGYLALRYGFIEGFHYQVEDSDEVHVFEHGTLQAAEAPDPRKDPTILVPAGYLEWYAKKSSPGRQGTSGAGS